MTRGLVRSSVLLAAILAAGQPVEASAPAAIGPGERPVAGSTEAELWYGMDQAEKDIRQSPLLVRDPALNAYVHGVACKLTGPYCPQLRVYIIDAPAFNAAMAPNGAMLVFTGALLRMQDEAELALVLGHEFAHFRQRHSLRFWQKAKRTTAWMATFSAVTYAGGVGLVGGLAQMAGLASMFQMSRDAEREADTIGFGQLVANGYDPQAGVRVWAAMLREEAASTVRKQTPIFASHPRTAERLQDVTAAAAAQPPGAAARNQAEYRRATRGFLQAWLDADLSRRVYGGSIQMYQDSLAVAPADARATWTFYLAEAHRRRNKGDDRARARALYRDAIALPDAPPQAWREQGMALRDEGDRAGAIAAFHTYLELAPKAGDRAFVERYLTDLEKQP